MAIMKLQKNEPSEKKNSLIKTTDFDPILELIDLLKSSQDRDEKGCPVIYFDKIKDLVVGDGLDWGCIAKFDVYCLVVSNGILYGGGNVHDVHGNSLSSKIEYCPLYDDETNIFNTILAYYHGTPAHILEKLKDCQELNVRMGLALNPNSPQEILEHLFKDQSVAVRGALSYNPNLPDRFFKELVCDSSPEVRESVADNFRTSHEQLKILSNDSNLNVAELAKFRILYNNSSYLKMESNSKYPEDRAFAAWNPITPIENLEQLAKDENINVIKKLASNRNLPEHLARKLSVHSSPFVRSVLAQNDCVSVDILKKLSSDPSTMVSIEATITLKRVNVRNKKNLNQKHYSSIKF